MNNKLVLLTAVLVLQLVLVLLFRLQTQPTPQEESVLLSFEPSEVQGITLGDGNQEVNLLRSGDGWQVGSYPADAAKAADILEKLATLDMQWPVATTAASAVRFEVAQDKFQRRVVLDGAGDVPALYLGTSPGFQKVHGRRAGSDAIYSIGLSNFELPVNVDGWLNKKMFALNQAPTSVTLTPADPEAPAQNLVKTDTGWLYNGAAADAAVATTYSNRFTTLQITGVIEQAPEGLEQQARIDLSNDAEQKQVTISRVGDSDEYYISSAGEPALFSLATYIAEQLLMTDVDFSAAEPNEEAGSLQGDD